MTQGFDYSKLTGKLYEIAQMADNQGDGEARANSRLEGKELSIFESNAKLHLGTEGYDYTQEDINAVLGFNKSTPAATTNPIAETKKEGKKERETVKDTVKDLVKQGIAPDELIKALKDEKYGKLSNPKYANEIAEVQYILDAVGTYNSKEDVENVHKNVKAKLKAANKWDSFHKDLLDSIEEQAKNNQINKEFEKMVEVYNQIKETLTAQGKAQNFEEYYKLTKGKFDKKESYTKEALKKLEEFAKDDAKSSVVDRMERTTSTGKMGIRKELRKEAGKDDFQKDAIQDLKTERKIVAREHKVDNKITDLSSVSANELKKQLSEMGNQYNFAKKLFTRKRIANNIFDKLDKSYLPKVKKADGNYDLSELAQVLKDHIGADYKVNQSKDQKMSEVENLKVALKDLTGEDFTDNQIGVLVNLFDFKREHVDRTPRLAKAIGQGVVGALSGAFGALASSEQLDVTQCVNLKFESAAMADDVIKELDKQGIKYSKTALTNGKLGIKILQKVSIDDRLSNILVSSLGGAAIGVLTSAMTDIIFGNVQDEKSCYSVSDYQPAKEVYKRDENGNLIKDENGKFVKELVENTTYTKPEEYKKHFANTTKNPEKIQAMNTLVDAYVKEYGDDWHSKLHQAIIRMAGTGSKLNPEECKMMKFQKPIEDKTTQTPSTNPDAPANKPPQDTTNPDPSSETVCNVETWSDTVDKTVTHTRRGGDTWGGIVKAYYPCLVQEKGLSGAIRALKTALATDENGNIDRATYQALLKGGDLPKTMKLPARIGDCDINKDATVKRVKVHGNGKARIQSVGRDSKETTWTAQDCHNKTAYGKTEAEARENLKKANK